MKPSGIMLRNRDGHYASRVRRPLEHQGSVRQSDAGNRVFRGTLQPDAMSAAPKHTSRSSAALAQRAAALCMSLKANDVVILSLKGVSDMTDYFVIASGTSDTHVRSIAEHVVEEMKKGGDSAYHVEGLQQGRWVLVDFVDVVVHVFHPVLRSFYQLERLWGDASPVPLAQEGARA